MVLPILYNIKLWKEMKRMVEKRGHNESGNSSYLCKCYEKIGKSNIERYSEGMRENEKNNQVLIVSGN